MQRVTLCVLLSAALMTSSTQAQTTPAMRGTYVLNRASSDDVNHAIEAAIKGMSFITRPIARSRLRRTTSVYERLVIAFDSATITTRLDEHPPIPAPATGAVIKWRREDGEVFDLSAHWVGAHIVQTFRAPDGMRENTFVLQPDGNTLEMHAKLSSPRLPRAVEYRLVYNRRD